MNLFYKNSTEKLNCLGAFKQKDIKNALQILKPYIPQISKTLNESKNFEKHFKFPYLQVYTENNISDSTCYLNYSPFDNSSLGEIRIELAHSQDYVDFQKKCILKITVENSLGHVQKNTISTKLKFIELLYNKEKDTTTLSISRQSYKYNQRNAEESYGKEIIEKEIELNEFSDLI